MSARTMVPCRADAERAAAALADVGVSRVVLFGSVARGEATERSDIDLAAIYDDLDYRTCSVRVQELSSLASAAAGHPVEVFLTDRPEWKVRTEQGWGGAGRPRCRQSELGQGDGHAQHRLRGSVDNASRNPVWVDVTLGEIVARP